MMFVVCICAFIISLVITVPIRKYAAPKLGFIDKPTDDRRMHSNAVPLGGGIAVYIAFCTVILLYGANLGIPYIIGGTLIVICGLIDDRISLHASIKLIFQFAASIVLCIFGITIESIELFGHCISTGIFEYPLTVIWVIAITNAFNLIDGLDGLCVGLSSIAAGGIAVFAWIGSMTEIAVLASVFMFACIGFFLHNVYPAKIFAGDTGAMFFGFMLAALCMQLSFKSDATVSALVPTVLLGIPIFDTVYAVIRRLRAKTNIFKGDKKHIHHVLSERFSHPTAVLILLLFALICFGIAAVILYVNELLGVILALLLTILSAFFFVLNSRKNEK